MNNNCSLAGYMLEEPSIILRLSCLLHVFMILFDVLLYTCTIIMQICWNKVLTFGVGSIQLSFRTMCSPNTCNNPNVTTFQSNCAEGLHFSAFHCNYNYSYNNYATALNYAAGTSLMITRNHTQVIPGNNTFIRCLGLLFNWLHNMLRLVHILL